MSKLEELIQQYCPDGVEWKTLGELGSFYGGLSGKTKEDFKDGNAKFISYKNIYANPSLNINTDERVKIAEGEKQHTIQYGDILFTGSSETPDECGISSVLTEHTEEKLYLNSFCFGFRLNDLSLFCPDFLKHLFRSGDLRAQIGKTASGTTRFNVSKARFTNVSIPVPPLHVQEEIAEILDNFTELQAELQAELQKRLQQYNYYRNNLLGAFSTDGAAEKFAIEELSDFRRGSFPQPYTRQDFYGGSGSMPFVQVADVAEEGFRLYPQTRQTISKIAQPSSVFVPQGTIICSLQGTIGKVAITQYDAYVDRTLAIFTNLKNTVLQKYFAYQLKAKFDIEKEKARGSTIKTITKEEFSKFIIPVPSLAEQQKIIDILDKFDALTTDLAQGLPAEIEKRKQQYEYYRDKLLTFNRIS